MRLGMIAYYATQRTDWQRAIMKTGHVINGDVNLQGGNDVSNYYWSTSVYNEDGIIDKTNFKRFSTRFNSEHKVTEWLKLGENIQLSYANNVGFDNNNSQTGLIFLHYALTLQYRWLMPGWNIRYFKSFC
jgi:hypothetical protein